MDGGGRRGLVEEGAEPFVAMLLLAKHFVAEGAFF